MQYGKIVKARFLERPNRFVAVVDLDGKKILVHVKNTGRCKELLVEGATVYLEDHSGRGRKLDYDLIAVEKVTERGTILINMDSQAPNAAAYEWICSGGIFGEDAVVRREVAYGNSRFDLYVEQGERRAFVEVKGVTLESDGVASFPDAPTERGVKHIGELAEAIKEGYEAYILFVVQMKEIHTFSPNDDTHKAFGDALRSAKAAGVKVLAYDCKVTPEEMKIDLPINIEL